MSMAGAAVRVILEQNDVGLFEFLDSIPVYFNPYCAGWSRDLTGGYRNLTNIHHPSGSVAKYGMTDSIGLSTNQVVSGLAGIDGSTLWRVPYWKVGSTYAGSSGSPLFDENRCIVGGLTGGESNCQGTSPDNGTDYFFSLGKSWETNDSTNQLKTYLDPQNKGGMYYSGRDPNRTNPIVRLANARYTQGDMLITSELDSPNQGFVFGNSNLPTLEFAEAFTVAHPVEIFGAYFLLPSMPFDTTSGVTVSVYTGSSSPETKVYSTAFIPRYLSYSSSSGFDSVPRTLSSVPTETFVVFDQPVPVTTKFFISYSIPTSATAKFCVYNTQWKDDSHTNTAWLKDASKGWVSAETYDYQHIKTSLAIQPLVRNRTITRIENVAVSESAGFYYERSGRMLTLKEPFITPGYLAVYSVEGQLLEKTAIQPGQSTFVLFKRPAGTLGIVKLVNNDSSYAGKIMY